MRRAILLSAVWFAIALALATSHILLRVPGPSPQTLCVVGVLLGVSFVRPPSSFDTRTARALTLFQCWRAIPAIAFLVMASRSVLPYSFALEAGIGDLAIAVTAPFIATTAESRPRLFRTWQIAGILDLVLVLASAAIHTVKGDARMLQLKVFPMAMLPLFLVPLSIVVHVIALRSRARPD